MTRSLSPDVSAPRPALRATDEWVTHASLLRERDARIVAMANREMGPVFEAEPETNRIEVGR